MYAYNLRMPNLTRLRKVVALLAVLLPCAETFSNLLTCRRECLDIKRHVSLRMDALSRADLLRNVGVPLAGVAGGNSSNVSFLLRLGLLTY